MHTSQDALNVVINVCRKALLSADERELCMRALEVVAARMNRAHELELAGAKGEAPPTPAPAVLTPAEEHKRQIEEAMAAATAATKRLTELTAPELAVAPSS